MGNTLNIISETTHPPHHTWQTIWESFQGFKEGGHVLPDFISGLTDLVYKGKLLMYYLVSLNLNLR